MVLWVYLRLTMEKIDKELIFLIKKEIALISFL